MPGYILHLTSAMMLQEKMKQNNILWTKKQQNDFFVGTLIPDSVKDKTYSHFRDSKTKGDMVQYPILDQFLQKYGTKLKNESCLGYYFHLYVDFHFFTEYLEKIVTFLNKKEEESFCLKEVTKARIKRTGKIVPIREFFSEKYYYGDYTKMNAYLVERFRLPLSLDTEVKNPGIDEVDYAAIEGILKELQGYMKISDAHEVQLEVFDLEDLLAYLEEIALTFLLSSERNLRFTDVV